MTDKSVNDDGLVMIQTYDETYQKIIHKDLTQQQLVRVWMYIRKR